MIRTKAILFCSAALWGGALAMPAVADTAAEELASQADPHAVTGGSATASDDGAIVVTARRREEKLVDVPTAASVIDITALTERGGANGIGELLADQPSVRFNNLNSSITSEISIRASSTARATNGDPSVGLYRNGAYIAGGPVGGRNFTRLDMLDIGRVEVLRGTQGALYGRNAVGGAVNIISAEPEFEAGGWASARYGFENNSLQVQGAVNVPLSDGLAMRISGDLVEQEKGFFYNPENDVYFDRQKGHALRGQIRLKRGPVDAVIMAETQRLTTPSIHYQIDIPRGTPGFPGGYTQDRYVYPWSTAPRAVQDVDGLQAIVRVDLGGADLVSTTSFRQRRSAYDLDNDGVNPVELARARSAGQVGPLNPIDPNGASYVTDRTDNFSQNLHVSGQSDRLTWLVGAEALLLDSDFSVETLRTPTLANSSKGNIAPAKLNFESYAAYGSLGYDLTDALNITGELRYTHDRRSIRARAYHVETGLPFGGADRIIDDALSADNLSYNATISYKFAPAVLGYAKVGTSYRAGEPSSPEARAFMQLPSTSPSTMAAPDGGPRTASLMTPQHISEVGGYRYDWSDLQAAIDADDEIPNGYFIVGNASDSAFLFAYEKGSFGPDRVTHLASASKWFIGALTVRMAEAAIVDLDDGMRPALPYWSLAGNKKDVKLKHLISMTSGFNGSPLVGGCQLTPSLLLYNCAKNIHDLRYDILRPGNAPGAQFSYGPHAMQIAAAYLEAKDISLEPSATPARERNVHELFAQHVTQPLGMASTSWYDPSGTSPTNPWIAGGAYSTARDYAKLLRAFLGGSFINNMAAFTQSRTSGLPRIFVPAPAASWEYALGSFVECSASTSCATSQINSSPGAYGWLGWIDRENEYYGLIATELASAGDRKSVELEQQMQPLIEAAIASRTPI